MAANFGKIYTGLRFVPVSTTAVSVAGDCDFATDTNKLALHNGTTSSPLVTEAHTATLTNKSIDAASNTLTNIDNSSIKAAAAIAVNKLAAVTASKALQSDASGFVSASAVTNTELGYVSGVTSAIQTQLNGKQASGNYITDLTGDVSASGPGSSAATVNSIGTSSAANVHSAELAANAATATNTNSTIVKRDGSGNFSATTITANLTGNASGTSANVTGVVATANGGTNLSSYTTGDTVYASASNVLSKLAIGSTGQVYTIAGGVPTWATPGGISWSIVSGTSQSVSPDNGYIATNVSQTIFTLPVTCPVGKTFKLASTTTGGWKLAQNAGQSIQDNVTSSTVGTSGFLASQSQYSSVEVVCTVADTNFQVISYRGSIVIGGAYSVSYLVVAGGGGGGGGIGGGGGAGGLLSGSGYSLTSGNTYTITVGGGGAGGTGANNGVNGSNSVFDTFTAIGGGGGGYYQGSGNSGNSGGSGGGGGLSAGPGTGGAGTGGQGFAGGSDTSGGFESAGGGGSGGAAPDTSSTNRIGGDGGAGTSNSITGSAVFYASGGGGTGTISGPGGTASAGGGGNGGIFAGTVGTNATANTGGGGGGYQGNGGSGVVILSIPTASYSGVTTGSPTVTTSGGNTILKYTASGTYTA